VVIAFVIMEKVKVELNGNFPLILTASIGCPRPRQSAVHIREVDYFVSPHLGV
jgi:hypothetical protein